MHYRDTSPSTYYCLFHASTGVFRTVSPPGHWARLLEKDWRAFASRLRSRSASSRVIYLKGMDLFCRWLEEAGHDPRLVLGVTVVREGGEEYEVLAAPRRLSRLAEDWAGSMVGNGVSPRAVNTFLAGLRFFARSYGTELSVEGVKEPLRMVGSDFIQKSEIERVLRRLKNSREPTARVWLGAFSLMATTGVRGSTLLTLTESNFDPSLFDDKGLVLLHVRPEQTKTGVEHVTFTTFQTYRFVQETMQFYADFFGRDYSGGRIYPWTPGTLRMKWRRLLVKTGLVARMGNRYYVRRLHTLRKYFYTSLKVAGVPETHVKMFMGHFTPLEAAYGRILVSKGGLEQLAESYLKAVDSFRFNLGQGV